MLENNTNLTSTDIAFGRDTYLSIRDFYTPKEWNLMYTYLNNYEESLKDEDMNLDTVSQECYLLLDEFMNTSAEDTHSYVQIMDKARTIDLTLLAEDPDKKKIYSLENSLQQIRYIINNRKYLSAYILSLQEYERNLFIDFLNKLNEDHENVKVPAFLNEQAAIVKLMVYCYLSSKDRFTPSEYNRHTTIKAMKVARQVEHFQTEYSIIKQFVQNDFFAFASLCNISDIDGCNDEFCTVVGSFFLYFLLYDNNWKEYFWGSFFKNMLQNNQYIAFIKFLMNKGDDPKVNVFCDELEEYYKSIGEPSPFDLSILPNRYVVKSDMDKSHKKWFEKISEVKYGGVDNKLYQKLGKLYDYLLEKGWIELGKKNTFIYRLSGFGDVPFNLEHGIKWLGKGTELGFLILALYNHYNKERDLVVSPPYEKIKKYFGEEGNIRGVSNKWINSKTWHKIKCMLEDCGFENLDPIMDDSKDKKRR